MKQITAVIKPFKLDEVREALADVRGDRFDSDGSEGLRSSERAYRVIPRSWICGWFLPKIKLEVVVDDKICDQVVDAVIKAAHTGKIGDGKIFVQNVEQVIRIRTGETGPEAV